MNRYPEHDHQRYKAAVRDVVQAAISNGGIVDAACLASYPEEFHVGKTRIPTPDPATVSQENLDMIRLWDMLLTTAVVNYELTVKTGAQQIKEWQCLTDVKLSQDRIARTVKADPAIRFVCAQEVHGGTSFFKTIEATHPAAVIALSQEEEEQQQQLQAPGVKDVCLCDLKGQSRTSKEANDMLAAAAAAHSAPSSAAPVCFKRTAALITSENGTVIFGCHWKAPTIQEARIVLQEYHKIAAAVAVKAGRGTAARWVAIGDFNFDQKRMGPTYMAQGVLQTAISSSSPEAAAAAAAAGVDVHAVVTSKETGYLAWTTSKCRTDASAQGSKKVGVAVQAAKDLMITSKDLFKDATVEAQFAVDDTLCSTNLSDHKFVRFQATASPHEIEPGMAFLTANCGGNSTGLAEFATSVHDPKFTAIEAIVNHPLVTSLLTHMLRSNEHLQHAYRKYFGKELQVDDDDEPLKVTDVYRTQQAPAANEHKTKTPRFNLLACRFR